MVWLERLVIKELREIEVCLDLEVFRGFLGSLEIRDFGEILVM